MESSSTPDLSNHHAGIVIVAVAAQFSFWATFLLIGILSYYRIRNWDPSQTRHVICSEEFCMKFLRSQFAILFFDLLLSDWVQALGFSLNFAHASEDLILNSSVCVTQGVLIQLGDVSSAFSTLLIAIHTFIVLVIRSPPTTTALLSLLAIKWFAAIVLAIIGPVFFATQLLGPFYAPAGGWCWISGTYSWPRLYLHYIWLFIAGIASAVIYGLTFVTIRRRIRSQVHQQSSSHSATDRSSHERNSMENAARKMLVYPLCYLFLTVPLAIYRIAGISGHPWQLDAQLVCGSIFTLAGFVDSIVFCWTRNLFSAITRDRSRPSFSTGSSSILTPSPLEKKESLPLESYVPHPEPIKPNPIIGLKGILQGGSALQFMPAKYSLATIDLNSFDEASP